MTVNATGEDGSGIAPSSASSSPATAGAAPGATPRTEAVAASPTTHASSVTAVTALRAPTESAESKPARPAKPVRKKAQEAPPEGAKPAAPAQRATASLSAQGVRKKAGAQQRGGAVPTVATTSARKGIAPRPAAAPPLTPAKAAAAPWPVRQAVAAAQRHEPMESVDAPATTRTSKPKGRPVRDSFTMPPRDFGLIALLKDRALEFKRPTKKSELLRAGLHALSAMKRKELKAALEQLTPIESGRPKKPG